MSAANKLPIFRRWWMKAWLVFGLGILFGFLPLQSVTAQEAGMLVYPFYGPWRTPSQGYWSQHRALDFYIPDYDRVVADAGGVVDLVDWWNDDCHQYYGGDDPYNCGFGLHLRINHGAYRTWYAHLSATAFDLGSSNNPAYPGRVVGTSGHNGYSSAPHLHFQFQKLVNGVWSNQDPRHYWMDQPVTATPAVGDTTIVDEMDPGFSRRGTWHFESAGYGGSMRWTYVKDNPMNDARWRPTLPEPGVYEVWIYVPGVRATTWQARYQVNHAAGTAYGRVDQQGLHDRWVNIGAYYFPAGAQGSVFIEDDTGEGYRVHCYDAVGILPVGQYRCSVGVDAVKFVRRDLPGIYQPDLRNRNGWKSRFYIQNSGGAPTQMWITLFDANGTAVCGGMPFSLPPYSMVTVLVDACGTAIRTGIVNSGEELSIAVSQRRRNPDTAAAYTAIHLPGASVYVPLLMKNNYGLDSRIYIQNTGSAATTPNLRFRPAPGFPGNADTYSLGSSIPPKGQAIVELDDIGDIGGQFIGSVQIFAGQPLAVTWTQHLANELLQESGTAGGTGPTIYAPLVQNDNWGIISGMAMQNASSRDDQLLSLKYHRDSDGRVCTTRYQELDRRYAAIYPSPPYQGNPAVPCSAVLSAVISGEGHDTGGMVSQVLPGTVVATDYPAIARPARKVDLPVLWKAWGGRNSGFVIQNTTGQPTAVTILYYRSDGIRACVTDFALGALGESKVIYPLPGCVGSTFFGSAIISANREVAVVVNHLFGTTGDNSLSHIGVHR